MSSAQVALVMGASRGIGRQIAIDLAREKYIGISNEQPTSPSPGLTRTSNASSENNVRRKHNTISA